MNKLAKILLYGNAEKRDFENVFADITESNQKNMIVFTGIAAVGMAIMVAASFFDASLEKNRLAYCVCVLVSALLFLVLKKCSKDQKGLIYSCVYIFEGLLFAFGIALGTFVEPNEVSVSFPVMMFAVPLFFTDIPLRMNISVAAGIACYYVAARYTQDSVMLGYNLSNILPYGLISMIVSTYMMTIKIRRHILEHENKYLIESDQLTGMLNRRCFEQHLQMIRKNGCTPGTMVCTFDVNGLKRVNDNLGHHAGDELIRGAAGCIEGVFGPYGHCYRTGGDEFMAILEGACPSEEELRNALNMRCSCFNGVHVSGLSVSLGIVVAEEGSSMDEMIKAADKAMYEDKHRYYTEIGVDRRTR